MKATDEHPAATVAFEEQGQLGPDFHQRDEDNIDASRDQPAAQMRWLLNTGQRLPRLRNAWGQRRG